MASFGYMVFGRPPVAEEPIPLGRILRMDIISHAVRDNEDSIRISLEFALLQEFLDVLLKNPERRTASSSQISAIEIYGIYLSVKAESLDIEPVSRQ